MTAEDLAVLPKTVGVLVSAPATARGGGGGGDGGEGGLDASQLTCSIKSYDDASIESKDAWHELMDDFSARLKAAEVGESKVAEGDDNERTNLLSRYHKYRDELDGCDDKGRTTENTGRLLRILLIASMVIALLGLARLVDLAFLPALFAW